MQTRRFLLVSTAACAVAAVLAAGVPVRAGAALDAFTSAWAAVDDYTVTITGHETKGTDVQDRVYHYAFKKPHFARIDIVAGPGRGGGAVWTGGDRVTGHQGGFISFVKLNVSIHDPRATSLRGDTIDYASFGSALAFFTSTKGALSEAQGPAIAGTATDAVTLVLADPTANGGITKEVLDLSRSTHLPVRRETYVGSSLVKEETFSDLKVNPGLKESDF